jgi:hypothetical protein
VHHRALVLVDADSGFEEGVEVAVAGEADGYGIGQLVGYEDPDVHALLRAGGDGGARLLVGDEVRRGDVQRPARGEERQQEEKAQGVVFVRRSARR